MPVWGGAYLPAGTPRPIVERLSREIVEVLHTPEVSDKLIAMGQVPIGNTPEEFAESYRRDFPRWEALIKASGARLE
jgi:tripartite-type tricarboxylate transporter receptor subunit TctC